jgi:hypothetical protein
MHNMTMIMHAMLPLVNVTEEMADGWWRGEDEEFEKQEAEILINKYEGHLRYYCFTYHECCFASEADVLIFLSMLLYREARRTAKSFRVKNAINKRILTRLAFKKCK